MWPRSPSLPPELTLPAAFPFPVGNPILRSPRPKPWAPSLSPHPTARPQQVLWLFLQKRSGTHCVPAPSVLSHHHLPPGPSHGSSARPSSAASLSQFSTRGPSCGGKAQALSSSPPAHTAAASLPTRPVCTAVPSAWNVLPTSLQEDPPVTETSSSTAPGSGVLTATEGTRPHQCDHSPGPMMGTGSSR